MDTDTRYDAAHEALETHIAWYETHAEAEQLAAAEGRMADASAHHEACRILVAVIDKETRP